MTAAANRSNAAPTRLCISPRDIAPLHTTMMELLGIATDPDVCFDKLESIIARDQALTTRLLAVANSPYYGCSRKVESVRTAIALLGTQQVQNIASAMALAPAFTSRHGTRLWVHGLTTALWTGHVMELLQTPRLGCLFTAALIHDIGIVLLLGNAPKEESECIAIALAEQRPLSEVEREHLGVDHGEIGGSACVAWNLPERIVKLVNRHHADRPDNGDGLDSDVLLLAELLATHSGASALERKDDPVWPEETLQSIGVDVADMDALLERSEEVVTAASSF